MNRTRTARRAAQMTAQTLFLMESISFAILSAAQFCGIFSGHSGAIPGIVLTALWNVGAVGCYQASGPFAVDAVKAAHTLRK